MALDVFNALTGLEHALDFHVQRHGVLASNLANADTPNFVAKDLRFDAQLQGAGALATTHDGHIGVGGKQGSSFREIEGPAGTTLDGNGVQVEEALAQVTANRLRFETGIELTRRHVAILRYAANDGAGA